MDLGFDVCPSLVQLAVLIEDARRRIRPKKSVICVGEKLLAASIIGALLFGKALAAEIAGHLFKYSPAARRTVWSLTLPQVAATLAATLVGFKTFDPNGARLIDERILNAQDITSSWIPLNVGARWKYDVESKSGDRQHPTVRSWTQEEVVSKLVKVPEGLVVVKTTRGRSSNDFLASWSGSSFLVRNNCLYFLVGRNDWDETRQQIGVRFKQELNGGISQPDLCFPMESGRQWGSLDTVWHVVGFGPSEFADPMYPESFHITGRLGSGGATGVWFAKGAGIVAIHYLHQGTYDEYVKKLRAFQPN